VSATERPTEQLTLGDLRVSLPAAGGVADEAKSEAGVEPRLSVIITYFRGQDTIAGAVRSVLEQTVAPHEIVICDDGSPDDLLAGLGELREHVRIVRKENGGTGSALNAAAEAAEGEYLVQLDVDDAFMPRRLEAVAAVLRARPEVDIVTGDALIEWGDRVLSTMGRLNPPALAGGRETMLERNWIPWPAARRSLVLGEGGWDTRFKVFEDWDCWMRMVLAGAVVAYVHEPLYRWRLSPDSRSSVSRVAHFEDQVLMTEKALAGSNLTPPEREKASALLTSRRLSLLRAQARDAILDGTPGARRRSLEILYGSGFDTTTRLKAAVAVISPRLAGRLLERRAESADPAVAELARRGFSESVELAGAERGA
jgi:Glycosyl transferase family 2